MPHHHHDHRRHWQCQQYAGKTEQFTTRQNREDHRHRVQTDSVAHQQRGKDHAFQRLANHEHRDNPQHRVKLAAKLEQPGNNCRADTDHKAHVRHNRRQTGNHADQQAQFQPNQHQARGIDKAQRHHHQQLTANKRTEHFVALACQFDDLLFPMPRQQAANLGHHHVPIPQQVETHHRNQHQIGQPADQRQTRRRGLSQDHADDVASLAHVLGNRGLDLVELPEAVSQPQLGLSPGQGGVLQPVEHLRRQLVQPEQLLGEHWHQDQQQGHEHHGEQAEHHDNAQGSRQTGRFQAIDQRISHIRQQQCDQERGENRVQQIDEHAQQENPAKPEQTT